MFLDVGSFPCKTWVRTKGPLLSPQPLLGHMTGKDDISGLTWPLFISRFLQAQGSPGFLEARLCGQDREFSFQEIRTHGRELQASLC